MRWSWRIGSLAGIPLHVHATFVVLIAWIAAIHWMESRRVLDALEGAGFILALFGCVVLHELGHALVARRYGVATRDITLLPIGGVARLERIPEVPRQEALVALAGPAVNLGIAFLLLAGLWLGGMRVTSLDVGAGASFLTRLLALNVFLAGFNLLPAFPMDGGRVLRAALAARTSYTRATGIAASVGQGMALLFGLAGLFGGNPFLVFIALFVWLGAAGESSMVQMRSAFQGIPVDRVMLRDFETLSARDPLARAVELTLAGSQEDFPVLDDAGEVIGILRQADLVSGLRSAGDAATAERFACRDFEPVDADELLEAVFGRLERRACHTLPVLRRGRLVGLLTMGNLGEFVRIQSALAGGRDAAA